PVPHVLPAVPFCPTTPFQPTKPAPGFCNLSDSEPAPGLQSIVTLRFDTKLGILMPEMTFPTMVDCSAKLGARKEVPQSPRTNTPASREIVQLKPILGLLVPPTSLYWS